jgi:cytochrome d ubiquinol oxidase subunit II
MLQTLPLVFALAGLALYTVLAGADFGAGFWLLFAGRGEDGDRVREHAHHSMAPVWEANHVWLIFVLTVTWTAYPVFFGSIASTLAVALFIAGLGIILRGASYALRSGATRRRETRAIDTVFAVASLVTPFALGAAAGGIASERVPVGNAAGDLFTSWLNPTSILIGALAVASSAYLAAVYLAADAARIGEPGLERAFRTRALATGVITGAIAVGGLAVIESDAHSLFEELIRGGALAAMIASVLAGAATLGLVWGRRFEAARYSAAVAVAAVIGGWALARYPTLLPGLTVHQAAASHDTLVTLVVAVLGGAVILFPSLGLLFRLTLSGQFDPHRDRAHPDAAAVQALRPALGGRLALALLIIGIGLLNVATAAWAHGVGVVSLFAFMVLAFFSVVPRALTEDPGEPPAGADGETGQPAGQ